MLDGPVVYRLARRLGLRAADLGDVPQLGMIEIA